MKPYTYTRSNRSFVGYLFPVAGIILLGLLVAQQRWHLFKNSPQVSISLFMFGVLLVVVGGAGLIVRREWTMEINNEQLTWSDGKRSGELLMRDVKRVRVEEGDARRLIAEIPGKEPYIIPGDCYGDAIVLREWLRINFGDTLEVLLS